MGRCISVATRAHEFLAPNFWLQITRIGVASHIRSIERCAQGNDARSRKEARRAELAAIRDEIVKPGNELNDQATKKGAYTPCSK